MCNVITIKTEDRMNFLPENFGSIFLQFETAVFGVAGKIVKGYGGGMWDFAKSDNGACFMYNEDITEVSNIFSGVTAKVDAILAGAIISVYALGLTLEASYVDDMAIMHDSLVRFAYDYAEKNGFGDAAYKMLD